MSRLYASLRLTEKCVTPSMSRHENPLSIANAPDASAGSAEERERHIASPSGHPPGRRRSVAGNIGWQFSNAFTLTGGYTGVPGSRSLVATFPFFTANDRTMADNFFRPGFTQGVWASGEPVKGLNYLAFLGNGLNTLSITANKIDTNLLFSSSVWWEPLGAYGEPGRSRNMYDDYFSSRKVRIRLGTAFTRSRENRFSDLDQSSPENTSIYNSDGVQAFATGAFAPGVTLQDATYKMSAIDYGIKWNGLAVNGQYFLRSLNDFVADGPLPLASTFDHRGEFSASYFVKPKKLMPYVRGSWVRGQFRNPYEYGAGLRWYYLPTERLWLNAEVFHINGVLTAGALEVVTKLSSGDARRALTLPRTLSGFRIERSVAPLDQV